MTCHPFAPSLASMAKKERRDEDEFCSGPGALRRLFAAATGTGRRYDAWHGQFRNLLQTGSAEAVQSGHAVPAFVLVPRVATNVRGCADSRSGMRHRLLGHRTQPVVESSRRAAGKKPRRG